MINNKLTLHRSLITNKLIKSFSLLLIISYSFDLQIYLFLKGSNKIIYCKILLSDAQRKFVN